MDSAELLRAIATDNAQATAVLLFRGAGSAFVGASVMPSKIAKALGHEDLYRRMRTHELLVDLALENLRALYALRSKSKDDDAQPVRACARMDVLRQAAECLLKRKPVSNEDEDEANQAKRRRHL